MPAFQLRLLGGFELIDLASGTAIAIPSKKAKALLAVLAVTPRMAASRSRLAALLWSEASDEQARQSLRQLLSNLRRNSRPVPIVFDDATVGLDEAAVAVDVLSLRDAPVDARLPELARAVAVYRGPFGQGLETGDAEFDEWLGAERRRIDDLVIPLMDRLVRELASAGSNREALNQATALLAISPLREETHRLIIAQEALVSGRASAMQRYEEFRILLRDELAVRPEPATMHLIDRLRNLPSPSAEGAQPAPAVPPAEVAPQVVARDHAEVTARNSWRLGGFAAAAVALVALAAWGIADYRNGDSDNAMSYLGESDGRLSVALLPFQGVATDSASQAQRGALNAETALAFSRNNRLSLVDASDTQAGQSVARLVRQLRARYLVRTEFSGAADAARADVTLIDSASKVSIWSASVPVGDALPIKFAREVYGYVMSEITLHQARTTSKADRDSVDAMLWRARAAQLQTRIGADDPTAADLYNAILAREPNHLFALLGLSDTYILRVARDRSDNRAADIRAAGELLTRAKPQAPNSSDIAFKEGMLNKLQGKFQQSAVDFDYAVRLDPTHWNAAAQYAHVLMFLGRIEEGFALMQRSTEYLLPDIGAAETAYIAGETALVAGHPDEAVRYLNMAVAGNQTVGRLHALQAAALQAAGRSDEAKAAANQARVLSPNYTPRIMNLRGGPNASPLYAEARGRFSDAFRIARGDPVLAPTATSN